MLQNLQQLVVPLLGVDVEHQRTRGVGRVGHVAFSAGQPPGQEAVHRAEAQLAPLGALPRPRHRVKQPHGLGAGKIRVDEQAGLPAEQRGQAVFLQPLHDGRCPPALPDDRAPDRLAGLPVPDHGRFALVGQADRLDVAHVDPRPAHRLAQRVHLALIDVLRIVLDPAGLRVVLRKLVVMRGDLAPLLVENHCPRAGGSLVKRHNVLHVILPSVFTYRLQSVFTSFLTYSAQRGPFTGVFSRQHQVESRRFSPRKVNRRLPGYSAPVSARLT